MDCWGRCFALRAHGDVGVGFRPRPENVVTQLSKLLTRRLPGWRSEGCLICSVLPCRVETNLLPDCTPKRGRLPLSIRGSSTCTLFRAPSSTALAPSRLPGWFGYSQLHTENLEPIDKMPGTQRRLLSGIVYSAQPIRHQLMGSTPTRPIRPFEQP